MTDPRLVEPQRVADDACAHRYWCAKRITATVVLAVLLVLVAVLIWRWA
jgi:hypothetical protein